MFTNDDIITTLHALLKDRGWSVNKLAHKADLSQSTINSLFHGGKGYYPSIPTISKICDAFGITVPDFLRMVEDEEQLEPTPEEYRILRAVQKLGPKERKHLLEFLEALSIVNEE